MSQILAGIVQELTGIGGGSITLTDGVNTVTDATQITVTGGTVGGSTPDATLSINFNTPDSISSIYNAYPLDLPNWRAAIGKVKAGTADAIVLCVGDSTTLGYGSNATTNQMRYNGWPNILAKNLNTLGIPAEANGWMGDGGDYGGSSESSQYDSRLSVGSGWSGNGDAFVGGNSFTATSSTSPLAFTPLVPVDTFVITYFQYSGFTPTLGSFSYAVDSGSTTNVDTGSGSPALATTTVSTTLGTHTLNLNWVSNTVYIVGIDAYNSANKQVHILNAGWVGSLSSSWSSLASWPGFNIYNLGQNLTIIQLGINDMNNSVSTATFISNMQTLITACLASGDVLLMTSEPESTANASAATQLSFQQAVFTLATTNALGVVDMYGRWVSFTYSNALGLYIDLVHPNSTGYPDVSQAIFNVLGETGIASAQAPITLTTLGSSGAATFIDNTLNIPQYSGGSGSIPQSTFNIIG